MAIQRKIARARNRALVGAEVPVRWRPVAGDRFLWTARPLHAAPEIDGASDQRLRNRHRPGEIRPGSTSPKPTRLRCGWHAGFPQNPANVDGLGLINIAPRPPTPAPGPDPQKRGSPPGPASEASL